MPGLVANLGGADTSSARTILQLQTSANVSSRATSGPIAFTGVINIGACAACLGASSARSLVALIWTSVEELGLYQASFASRANIAASRQSKTPKAVRRVRPAQLLLCMAQFYHPNNLDQPGDGWLRVN